jgi:hypothetical protein
MFSKEDAYQALEGLDIRNNQVDAAELSDSCTVSEGTRLTSRTNTRPQQTASNVRPPRGIGSATRRSVRVRLKQRRHMAHEFTQESAVHMFDGIQAIATRIGRLHDHEHAIR